MTAILSLIALFFLILPSLLKDQGVLRLLCYIIVFIITVVEVGYKIDFYGSELRVSNVLLEFLVLFVLAFLIPKFYKEIKKEEL